MFGFDKKIENAPASQDNKPDLLTRLKKGLFQSPKEPPTEVVANDNSQSVKGDFFSRLKEGLNRTRENLNTNLVNLFQGRQSIDENVLEEIETILLTADVGGEATQLLVNDLRDRIAIQQITDVNGLFDALSQSLLSIVQPVEKPLTIPTDSDKPFVILMVGINGSGKTTTIGKLAKRFQAQGLSVMLAAGDTFRAAAVEQLKIWGERNNVPVIAQQGKADSAAVIFDALQAATARGIKVLIADTAGRLHTQDNLMEELKKVRRVITKLDATAPHEVILVVDATIGQNALVQTKQFHQAIGLSGITITKLDGTAKGGIVFAMAKQTGLPIRFIGVGERIDDLRQFEASGFVKALLSRD
jgi:fused signal recognition particle receptor